MTAQRPSRGKIIVFGILFWYPLAGVTYQFLHYLIGLRRLGYDPYYIEDSGRWVYDPCKNDLSPDASANIDVVAPVLAAHGFSDRWGFRGYYPGGRCYGLTEEKILKLYREADAFLNVTGAQEVRDEHLECPCRIYVETDPFAAQVRVAQGHQPTIATLAAHDTLFSFGENLGAPDCEVPVEQFRWHPTRQPVVLDLWYPPPIVPVSPIGQSRRGTTKEKTSAGVMRPISGPRTASFSSSSICRCVGLCHSNSRFAWMRLPGGNLTITAGR